MCAAAPFPPPAAAKKYLQRAVPPLAGIFCPQSRRRREHKAAARRQTSVPRSARHYQHHPAALRRGVHSLAILAKISPSGVVNILQNKTFSFFSKHLMGGTKCRPVHLRKYFCRLRRYRAAFCCPARPASNFAKASSDKKPPAFLQLFLGQGEVLLRSLMFFLGEAQKNKTK